MKKVLFILTILIYGLFSNAFGQISVPYYNNFDHPDDTIGWTHYSLSGADDWECGIPQGNYLNSALSPPNVWATNLDGNFTEFSVMCLETPYFDLSDTTEYIFSFAHQYKTQAYHGGNIEYSVDSGQTWQLLDGNSSEKINWYNNSNISILGQPGWSYSGYSSGFRFPGHSLGFLSGQNSVKFRFKFGGTSNPEEGWVIDNLRIVPNNINLVALNGKRFEASKYYPSFDVIAPIYYQGLITPSFSNTTLYYLSLDTILDTADTLLGSKTSTINGSVSSWSKTFNMIPDLPCGDYYIFMKHDANNNLTESNENDNIAYCILHIDSTFVTEYNEDFESSDNWWKSYAKYTQSGGTFGLNYWERGNNSIHKIFGTHSGENAWYIAHPPISGGSKTTHYLESPYFDLSSDSGNVICFWYKIYTTYSSTFNIGLGLSRSPDVPNYSTSFSITSPRFFDWDCNCLNMAYLDGHNNSKFRFYYYSNGNAVNYADYVVVDDIYLGLPKPDLSIEWNHSRTLNNSSTQDTIFYTIFNSGLDSVQQTTTKFYWSNDSILDNSDQYLGFTNEPPMLDTSYFFNHFVLTIPTTVASNYFIISVVDADSIINEMWEENNISVFPIVLTDIQAVPYENDFETQTDNWYHFSLFGNDDWSWAIPQGTVITDAFSGQKAFITQPNGLVSSQSLMLLYTPLFDLSSLNNPVLEFDMFLDNYTNVTKTYEQPHVNMSYSCDNGATWHVLERANQSFKGWYTRMEYNFTIGMDTYNGNSHTELLFDYFENSFIASNAYQGRDASRISKYIIDISHIKNYPRIQFRYNFVTPTNSLGDGALIDNFSIKEAAIDLYVNYKKSLMISSLSQEIKFFMNIKNQGNYISDSCIAQFYVSFDTILDSSDFYLGQDTIPEIRPDMNSYLNAIYNAPSNLTNYRYLIYEIDANNINIESNENNNTGYWPLALDSISNYPYTNDFNDTIVNGWNHYEKKYIINTHIKDQYRFRNMIAPAEVLYKSDLKSGEMFTDPIDVLAHIVPCWYLETPAFNFYTIDSILLSFDLMCTGYVENGGNFEYSTNGGNSWTVLTSQHGQTHNWYNKYNLDDLYGEPGWANYPAGYGIAILDSTSIDLSFLKGEQNVIFRYKYRSKYATHGTGSVQGMRIDNFKLEGFTVDYFANDTMVPISLANTPSDFIINYSITNLGQSNGRITTTKFFWSKDSIFDTNDSLIRVIYENPIPSGNTMSSSVNINKPLQITQSNYYIFYLTDADSNLLELNELNNVGSYKITFILYPNYYANIEWDSVNATISQPAFDITYSIINDGLSDGINSVTAFYWSFDSIFDGNDQNFHSVNENPILSGDTLLSLINIIYPIPISQPNYYLFYQVDHNDSITETNEGDNTGVFKIVFDYNNSIFDINFDNIDMYVSGNILFVNTPSDFKDSFYSLSIININGQISYQSEIKINAGSNIFHLLDYLSTGIYIISITNNDNNFSRKIIIRK